MNMKNKIQILENRYKLWRRGFVIIFIISLFGITMIGLSGTYYKILYEEAIKQGAEDTVTALQMVVACQDLSNLTSDEVLHRTIEMFILEEEGK